MPPRTPSAATVSFPPTRPVVSRLIPLRLKIGLNSLNEREPGPPALMRKRLLSASRGWMGDRKSTRLNSSHVAISYAVFCLKKKKKKICRYNASSIMHFNYSHRLQEIHSSSQST